VSYNSASVKHNKLIKYYKFNSGMRFSNSVGLPTGTLRFVRLLKKSITDTIHNDPYLYPKWMLQLY